MCRDKNAQPGTLKTVQHGGKTIKYYPWLHAQICTLAKVSCFSAIARAEEQDKDTASNVRNYKSVARLISSCQAGRATSLL